MSPFSCTRCQQRVRGPFRTVAQVAVVVLVTVALLGERSSTPTLASDNGPRGPSAPRRFRSSRESNHEPETTTHGSGRVTAVSRQVAHAHAQAGDVRVLHTTRDAEGRNRRVTGWVVGKQSDDDVVTEWDISLATHTTGAMEQQLRLPSRVCAILTLVHAFHVSSRHSVRAN